MQEIVAEEILSRFKGLEGQIRGVEVGVFKGRLSKFLLRDPRVILVLVDSWEPLGAAYLDKSDWHAGLGAAAQISAYFRTLVNVSLTRDRCKIVKGRSDAASRLEEDGSFDFVFIDADHSFSSVVRDIDHWYPKVKVGGWLMGHDYDHPLFPDVKEAVNYRCLKIETGRERVWAHQKET